MTHNFKDSFNKGGGGEEDMDKFFGNIYRIMRVPLDVETDFGVDRVFFNKQSGAQVSVEYKSDFKDTGNIFVETIGDDVENRPGWAVKCKADFLCYYMANDGDVFVVEPNAVRQHLPRWQRQYRTVTADNGNYKTVGVLVPVAELRRIAVRIYRLDGLSE